MMNIKRAFQTKNYSNSTSAAILVVRLVMGVAFMMHGFGKIQNPFAWMPPESPVPGIFQFLAALSEFGGGLALIIGLLTPLACLGIAFTMAVATAMHAFVMGDPFVSKGGGSYELALLYLSLSVLFIFLTPGKFSLDSFLFKERK